MSVLGGAGAAAGSVVGHNLGRGGLIVGGLLGGLLSVVGAGFLAHRLGWIRRRQLFSTNVGGVAGFVLACLVALSTLSSPLGLILSSLLIGTGALLGTVVARSAHEKA